MADVPSARRCRPAPGRSLPWAVLACAAVLAPGPDLRAQSVPDGLGDTWLRSIEAVLRETASEDDVGRLTFLYAVDVVYEHPRVGVRIEGRDRVAEAMVGYLGRTRNPDIDVHGSTTGEGVIVVDYTLEMEIRTDAGWQSLERRQITVLEVTAEGRIRRILDYW